MSVEPTIHHRDLLRGLACSIGAYSSLEFVEFLKRLDGISEPEKRILQRAWLSAEHLPKDASLERAHIRAALEHFITVLKARDAA